MFFAASILLPLVAASAAGPEPLACQPNDEQPMLPVFHIIGNVTKSADNSIKLEAINDCSGVTFYEGLWHVWHQVGRELRLLRKEGAKERQRGARRELITLAYF